MICAVSYPTVRVNKIQVKKVSFGDFKGEYKELKERYPKLTDSFEIQSRMSDLGHNAKTKKEIDCAINLINEIKTFFETNAAVQKDVRRIIKDSVIKQCGKTLSKLEQRLITCIK